MRQRRASGTLSGAALADHGGHPPVNENGECYEGDTYGNMYPAPADDPKRCCNSFAQYYGETRCDELVAQMEKACSQAEFDALRQQVLDNCCPYSAYDEAHKMTSVPTSHRASRSACEQMLGAMEGECGSKREDTRQQFRDGCCGLHDGLAEQEGNIPSGSFFPCEDGTGGGSGDQNQDNENDYDDSGDSPYKCGNTDEGKGGLWGKVIDGAFNIADDGMCALFPASCANGAGEQSVYCCRQEMPAGDVAGLLVLAADDPTGGATMTCGPGGAPPGWVPDWYPGGYTDSQYKQFSALAGLGILGAGLLAYSLFAGGDEDEQQPVIVQVGGQQTGQQTALKQKQTPKKNQKANESQS